MALEITLVQTEADLRDALSVRRRVFIEEQSVPEDIEVDKYDRLAEDAVAALHVLARLDGLPIATGRLVLDDAHPGFAHAGRVAVLKEHRGKGYGRAVMDALHTLARERGLEGVTLSAQLHAIPFYERLGYRAHGDVFIEAGIEHRWMDYEFA